MKNKLTELLNIEYPIIQGAMQYLSRAELAIAVSNAGGLGTIPAMTFRSPEELREEIQKIKSQTDKPFAVNISMLPEVIINELTMKFVDVIIEEKVPVVETSGRSPEELVPMFKENNIKHIHKVSSIRHAKKAQDLGVDAVTIVGFECGGHPGMDDVSSAILFAKASEELSIPVIGGGGICDGKSFYGAMSLGIDGVVIGTRFLLSEEVATSDIYKEKVLSFNENDTTLILRSLNNAMRVANNKQAKRIHDMEAEKASLKELLPVISGIKTYQAILNGEVDDAQLVVGQDIGRIHSVLPVSTIMEELVAGFKAQHNSMTLYFN
ncbi:MAG: nitronate monooxygenase [Vagococcus sp.]|uniref:NAD(P)H-dependent flavin oxidoreductase n=1 Tax=Vagococcus sp. TaxID=1933889 RepID=UPI002FC94BDD